MKIRLTARNWAAISAGIVQWAHGDECGIATLVITDESQEQSSHQYARSSGIGLSTLSGTVSRMNAGESYLSPAPSES